jgi:transcriptional regulator with GAF, ATPase, and Fis domain/tetratricopeptide (TPR) repeat protein
VRTANKVGNAGVAGAASGALGTLNDRYRLIRRLGEGASGEVFLADDLVAREPCAVKLHQQAEDADARRLLAEFSRLAELSHRSILRVRDVGRVRQGSFSGRPFLVTDHVAGRPLGSLGDGAGGGHRLARFLAAADDLADALAYLHGRGWIHGDLTPSNVLLDEAGRPILIDFGLSARAAGSAGGGAANGTLGFVAPEALVGERTPLCDIYGLGATLYAAWTGTPPFGTGLGAIRRAREGAPPTPSSLCPGLPPAWDGRLLRMLANAPEDRPGSARELLRELRQEQRPGEIELVLDAPHPKGDPLVGIFVGRAAERATLADAIERLTEGAAPVNLVVVRGAPGSGRRTLIDRVLRDARVAAVAGASADFDVDDRGVAALLRELAPAPGPAPGWDDPARLALARLGALVEALERRAAARPLCVVLAPGPDEEALAEAVAGTEPSGRLLVLLASERGPRRARAHVLPLGALSADEIRALATRAAGHPPPPEVAEALVRVSGGQAALAALLVRRWVERARAGQGLDLESGAGAGDLEATLDVAWSALDPEARQQVVACALRPEGASSGEWGEAAGAPEAGAAQALAAGWLRRDADGELVPASALHRAAVLRGLARPELRSIARAAAGALGVEDPRRGEAWAAAGERERAVESFGVAARAAYRTGHVGEAVRCWERAGALGGGPLPAEDRVSLAGALGVLGRYPEALAALDGPDAGGAGSLAALAERRAWILGRRGDLAAAREVLEAGIAALGGAGDPESVRARLALEARLARTFVSLGALDRALAAAAGPLAHGGGPAAAVAREAAVLARAYGGHVDEAEALLAAPDATHPGFEGRLAFLRGLCRQLAARPDQAALHYRAAAEAHAALQDLHAVASATFNLGCVLAEAGRYEEAVAALDRAIRELGRLGAGADLATALFNAGLLFVQLGDLASAERTVQRTREEGRARGLALFAAYADCLEGDLRRRQRTPARALPLYASATRAFDEAGNRLLAEVSRLARAEALAEAGQPAEALAGWTAVAGGQAAGAGALAEGLSLARARIALGAAAQAAEDRALAEELAALAGRAAAATRRPVAWRSAGLAARLFARTGDARAGALLEQARRTFEEVKMLSPAKFRAGLDADPDAPAAAAPAGASPAALSVLVDRAARAENRLRRLLRINKRLNSELRLGRVLETIIDTVIELTDAERGFLLLRDAGGELQVKVARNIEQGSLDAPDMALSRSIARQAAERGEPVITVDAAGDDRFRQALSVTDLHLRSVLAVPLAVKGNVVGTIYVDHRLRKGVFDDDDVALVLDFAEQGALAIENARILAELRRRERQVEGLNRRLERDLQARHEELSDVRQELRETREAAALRYDYRQIVGRTPRMLELFRLLDRVTDTSLPVVIQGESGTGKELVARAIHFNGPRRERPFVSENCAAIPETLLESTLFGYVRGAFTGADRDTRGLFAVADGGTLFLDEVGEMSPAMQGKLLRVLQDGEFRRVGGERPQKVDVRVVVATNRDLGRMVSEGKFRQDLFFRLSVVRLTLPPLRERSEDIPLLVQSFLERFAAAAGGGAVKGVEPAALARLAGYRWPGNVRELENEVQRAAAFAGPRITVDDLSPHVAAGAQGSSADDAPDSLLLRPRVERLERTLIREALRQHGGNQTKAAEALGLSRFGLQKKLRRYGIAS